MSPRPMLTAIFLAWLTVPAFSNWQFTRWGMSPYNVAALGSQIRKATPEEKELYKAPAPGELLLISGYATPAIAFVALYYFQDEKLIAVSLIPTDTKSVGKMQDSLRADYGKPTSQSTLNVSPGCVNWLKQWNVEWDGDLITFDWMFCLNGKELDTKRLRILYQPIRSSEGKGL
jgi:hypothetical protein